MQNHGEPARDRDLAFWKTTTFVAALRHDRIEAPWLLEDSIDGETFRIYLEEVLVPTLKPGDVVIMDNLEQPQGQSCAPAHPQSRSQAIPFAEIFARPEPDRAGLRQTQAPVAQANRPHS